MDNTRTGAAFAVLGALAFYASLLWGVFHNPSVIHAEPPSAQVWLGRVAAAVAVLGALVAFRGGRPRDTTKADFVAATAASAVVLPATAAAVSLGWELFVP